MFQKTIRQVGAYALELASLYDRKLYISANELEQIRIRYRRSILGRRVVDVFHVICIMTAIMSGNVKLAHKLIKSLRQIRNLRSESSRDRHNDRVIERAKVIGMSLGDKQLDDQQIEAVVASEDAQLVLAAAGSGKTMSLLAKCQYLCETVGLSASRILTISFTKASADELGERLSELGLGDVQARTFHALGKKIIGNDELQVAEGERQTVILKKVIASLVANDPIFAKRYHDFLLFYFTAPADMTDMTKLEDIVEFNRSFLGKSLQGVSLDKRSYQTDGKTYGNENVRSKEEQIIANFLYINSIPYVYEQPYPGSNGHYKPDFTLTQFDQPIYLEHQGINREGNTRADIDKVAYQRKIEWGHRNHEKHGTILLETFSYEWSEGTLLKNLEERLKKVGIELLRRDEAEIDRLLVAHYKSDTLSFFKLLQGFLSLYKNSDKNMDVLRSMARRLSKYDKIRTLMFLDVFEVVLIGYQAELRHTNEIDFADMIADATEQIPLLAESDLQFDYILVDEVQDLSQGRFALLKALLDHSPSARLFCVGDDWQSIFRFTGSDLTLIQDFDNYFDRTTRHSVIEQTHRFSNPLLDYSSNFIQKNPTQQPKVVYSLSDQKTELHISTDGGPNADDMAVDIILEQLSDQYGADLATMTINVLGRYNNDLFRLVEDQSLSFANNDSRTKTDRFVLVDKLSGRIFWRSSKTSAVVPIQFMTMHKAKGKTSDISIILNANDSSFGMPSKKQSDPVLNILLAHPDRYAYAEERRLFYVALTRARRQTFIVSSSDQVSPFVRELSPSSTESPLRCPKCHLGRLVERSGPYGVFTSCTNHYYGCTFNGKAQDNVDSRKIIQRRAAGEII